MNDAEIRKEKKAAKIFKNTALMGGIGFGLFVLSFIAPLIYRASTTGDMQDIFIKYGLYMMAYVGVMLVTFIFMRGYIFFINGLMQYLVLPTVAILFAMDIYNVIAG
ncbi:MAG: hypothetical protein R3D88_00800 [Alphaproteobacteria bacterium]|nr:hypothetical protein [Alphaproteobacteria bacterium]